MPTPPFRMTSSRSPRRRSVMLVAACLSIAWASNGCSPADGGTANARFDAGPSITGCPVSPTAKQYSLNGEDAPLPSALPSGVCSGEAACVLTVSVGPYCGDVSEYEDNYECECVKSLWNCVLTGSAGGVMLRGWCDGGNGTEDGG